MPSLSTWVIDIFYASYIRFLSITEAYGTHFLRAFESPNSSSSNCTKCTLGYTFYILWWTKLARGHHNQAIPTLPTLLNSSNSDQVMGGHDWQPEKLRPLWVLGWKPPEKSFDQWKTSEYRERSSYSICCLLSSSKRCQTVSAMQAACIS